MFGERVVVDAVVNDQVALICFFRTTMNKVCNKTIRADNTAAPKGSSSVTASTVLDIQRFRLHLDAKLHKWTNRLVLLVNE